jgi:hypothetical protein
MLILVSDKVVFLWFIQASSSFHDNVEQRVVHDKPKMDSLSSECMALWNASKEEA